MNIMMTNIKYVVNITLLHNVSVIMNLLLSHFFLDYQDIYYAQ